MKRWCILATVAMGCAFFPLGGWNASVSAQLVETAETCGVQVHAFYIEATATLPSGQASAVLRLANQAVREWPRGEAHTLPQGQMQRVTLAATCPPQAELAQAIQRRMRMMLGQDARISTCLTGRTQQGKATNLNALAEEALHSLEDLPKQALREQNLVSLTGERAQVALRSDQQGAMVFLACPLVPMDY